MREREFERLYLQSYGTVYGFVRARMASDADAEDVVSEAFIKAARSFASFNPNRAKFGTWVTAIAKNCMISHFRRERSTTPIDEVSERTFAVSGGQEAGENRERVQQLLACLDDSARMLAALKYRDGMRNVDIAADLGMNPSTVATVLASARAKMCAKLEGSG